MFDIEADGLLDSVKTIWCIVLKCTNTKEIFSYNVSNLNEGITKIQEADVLIGHNIICYDLPVLEKILGIKIQAKLFDTLLLSRMIWPEIGLTADSKGHYFIPGELFGSYSLGAFGYRLSHNKVVHEDWSAWSPAMQKRCEQDVEINYKLWELINEKLPPEKAIYIETEFQKFIHIQEQLGVYFDVEKALKLQAPLKNRIVSLTEELRRIIPPKEIKLKRSVKYEDFNPGSRIQIIEFLSRKYDWKPVDFTKKGNPELSDDILNSLPFPEAKLFAEYFKNQKLLGMISEGDKSWLKYVKDGKIHGRVTTLGAVTGRCTHTNPALACIPSARSFMGKEVRELFYAPEGMKMIGTDAKGLELRCFAHYLARYDGGAYANEVVHGDVHTRNMYAFGLTDRDISKTTMYAMLYGSGDAALAANSTSGTVPELTAIGTRMRHSFMDKVPAYRALVDDIRLQLIKNKKTLKGIDGRILQVRHNHAALNTLLQNAGSMAMKLAAVKLRDDLIKQGIPVMPCLNVHDEFQCYGSDKDAEEISRLSLKAIREAGEELDFKCPLEGNSKIGNNWAETH